MEGEVDINTWDSIEYRRAYGYCRVENESVMEQLLDLFALNYRKRDSLTVGVTEFIIINPTISPLLRIQEEITDNDDYCDLKLSFVRDIDIGNIEGIGVIDTESFMKGTVNRLETRSLFQLVALAKKYGGDYAVLWNQEYINESATDSVYLDCDLFQKYSLNSTIPPQSKSEDTQHIKGLLKAGVSLTLVYNLNPLSFKIDYDNSGTCISVINGQSSTTAGVWIYDTATDYNLLTYSNWGWGLNAGSELTFNYAPTSNFNMIGYKIISNNADTQVKLEAQRASDDVWEVIDTITNSQAHTYTDAKLWKDFRVKVKNVAGVMKTMSAYFYEMELYNT